MEYKYLRFFYCIKGLYVKSTDKEAMDWIISRAQSYVPSAKVDVLEARASGEISMCKIHGLNNRDREIGSQIVQELCQKGWEPFAITPIRYSATLEDEQGYYEAIHLKFRIP